MLRVYTAEPRCSNAEYLVCLRRVECGARQRGKVAGGKGGVSDGRVLLGLVFTVADELSDC